jgi:hypothetical protein
MYNAPGAFVMRTLFFLLSIIAFHASALAQFDLVDVKMQSGEVRPIMSLPWFQYQLQIQKGANANRATTADWIVYSPPRFCPISAWSYLRWNGSITAADRKLTEDGCNKRMFEVKLSLLPPDVKQVCGCRSVLETESTINSNKRALWKSYDDELLLDESFKLAADLVDKSGSIAPVLLTMGSKSAGIFGFDGSELCRYELDIFESHMKGIERLDALLKSDKRFKIPIQCVPDRQGEINFGDVSYSFWRQKITGEMQLKFKGGETYVIQFRQ